MFILFKMKPFRFRLMDVPFSLLAQILTLSPHRAKVMK